MLSRQSRIIKEIRALARDRAARDEARTFVIEGLVGLRDACAAGAKISRVVCTEEIEHEVKGIVGDSVPVDVAEHGAIENAASTVTPQPLVALAEMVDQPLAAIADANAVAWLIDVADPGNVGTTIRTCAAAGVGAVVMTGSCADLYNPKTVRSAAASLFIPTIVRGTEVAEGVQFFSEYDFNTYGLSSHADTNIWSEPFRQSPVFAFGNEAHGLPANLAVDKWIQIPMANDVESLNVAASAAVTIFEWRRQNDV